MAVIDFPICPTPSRRVFKPGRYPDTMFESLNGSVALVRFGYRYVNATLELGWNALPDKYAVSIIEHYEAVNGVFAASNNGDGEWNSVNFPRKTDQDMFDGVGQAYPPWANDDTDDKLRSILNQRGTGLKWRYSEPPSYESVFPNVCRMSCNFTAYLTR